MELPFSSIKKVKSLDKTPNIILSLVNINNTIDSNKWEKIKKIFAWKIGEKNKLFVKLSPDNSIINAKDKEKEIKINFTERFIDTNNVDNIHFVNKTKSIKAIYFYIKTLVTNEKTDNQNNHLMKVMNDIKKIENVDFISNKYIVEKFGCQKTYKYLMPPGNPTKLAPIPKPAPERAEAPILGK